MSAMAQINAALGQHKLDEAEGLDRPSAKKTATSRGGSAANRWPSTAGCSPMSSAYFPFSAFHHARHSSTSARRSFRLRQESCG